MVHKTGFPHSDIHGSKGARPSPQLFAACHVLHRLLAPRHPPDALFNASFFRLYPCPENEPEAHHFSSITWAKSVVLDQCRIHMSHTHLATTVARASECANKSRCRSLPMTEVTAKDASNRETSVNPRRPIDDLHRLSCASGLDAHANPPPQCQ